MTRARRLDQQDDDGGLVVKVKCKKFLIRNISDTNRELETLNEGEGAC